MDDKSLTEQVAKRADQLVVDDRIPDEYLAFRFNQGPAQVVFVAHEDVSTLPWIFVAYRYPNGQHDSMTIRPEAVLQVFPAADPTGHGYSRQADDPTTVSGGRVEPHTGGMTDSGLVDESDGKPMPGCLPRCRRTDSEYGKGSSAHATDCPEWRAAKAREDELPAGLIVGDTADEQRDNAYAAYERDEAEYLPNCPECMGQHHTVEPCR